MQNFVHEVVSKFTKKVERNFPDDLFASLMKKEFFLWWVDCVQLQGKGELQQPLHK